MHGTGGYSEGGLRPPQGAYRKDIIEGYLDDLNLVLHGAAKRVVGEVIANEVSYGDGRGTHAAAAAPRPQLVHT